MVQLFACYHILKMNVPTGTEQLCNTYVAINSNDRITGMPASQFNLRNQPLVNNIQSVTPVSFDGILFMENVTTRNNFFTVNGVLVTLTPGNYPSPSDMAAQIQTQLNAALGPIVFTVTDVSAMPGSARFRIDATANYTIDITGPRFEWLTGLTVTTVPALTNTFNYTILTATPFFDVCASQLHKGLPDDSSSGTIRGLLFRVQTGQIPFVLKDVITLQQSSKKSLFFPQATSWPTITWELLDEWAQPVVLAPNSIWWITLATSYHQPQRNVQPQYALV